LQVINVTNPAHPVRVGGEATNGPAIGVAVAQDHAYVLDGRSNLRIFDISDPTNVVSVGSIVTGAADLAVAGDYVYLASPVGLEVINVSDPQTPVAIGQCQTAGFAAAVAVSGNYAYLTDALGLQVIDVSDPTNCVHVGGDAGGDYGDVAVSGHYAFVTDYDDSAGLRIFDVSDPTNCVFVGGSGLPTYARRVAAAGRYAYVTDRDDGLHVIDISDPANPQVAGVYYTGFGGAGVIVVGGRIYMTAGAPGLLVIPTLRDVQFSVRVQATAGETFTLEAAIDLSALNPWTPLVTTNVATMPFDFVDFDVRVSEKPQKFYRVRQP
jgi:hypothetical protein